MMKCFTILFCFLFLTSTLLVPSTIAQKNSSVTEAQIKALSEDENFLAMHNTFQQIDIHFAQSLVKASQEQLDEWVMASKKLKKQAGSLSENEERKLLKELTGLSEKDVEKLGGQMEKFQREHPAFDTIDEIDTVLATYLRFDSLDEYIDYLITEKCRRDCSDKLTPILNEQWSMVTALISTVPGRGFRTEILRLYFELRTEPIELWRACMRACVR